MENCYEMARALILVPKSKYEQLLKQSEEHQQVGGNEAVTTAKEVVNPGSDIKMREDSSALEQQGTADQNDGQTSLSSQDFLYKDR